VSGHTVYLRRTDLMMFQHAECRVDTDSGLRVCSAMFGAETTRFAVISSPMGAGPRPCG
jgi:hypothetical protein